MDRPPLEVADLVRAAGDAFIEQSRKWITWKHVKVLLAILRCRTAALGGHLDECTRCGHRAISYNSCRNRHCPKCQAGGARRWLETRRQELLPTPYVHVVFTLPRELPPWPCRTKRSSTISCSEPARKPSVKSLAIRAILVRRSVSLACCIHGIRNYASPACPLCGPGRWIVARSPTGSTRYAFFLPVKVLSRVFRGKFVAALKSAFRDGQIAIPWRSAALAHTKDVLLVAEAAVPKGLGGLLQTTVWRPQHVLHYLVRYTHRVAISNHRLVLFADGRSRFVGAIPLTTTNRSC